MQQQHTIIISVEIKTLSLNLPKSWTAQLESSVGVEVGRWGATERRYCCIASARGLWVRVLLQPAGLIVSALIMQCTGTVVQPGRASHQKGATHVSNGENKMKY